MIWILSNRSVNGFRSSFSSPFYICFNLFLLLTTLGDINLFFKVVREFSLWFLSFSGKNEKSVESRGRFLIEFIHIKLQYAFFWVQWYLKLWIRSKNPIFKGVAMAPPNWPKWKHTVLHQFWNPLEEDVANFLIF